MDPGVRRFIERGISRRYRAATTAGDIEDLDALNLALADINSERFYAFRSEMDVANLWSKLRSTESGMAIDILNEGCAALYLYLGAQMWTELMQSVAAAITAGRTPIVAAKSGAYLSDDDYSYHTMTVAQWTAVINNNPWVAYAFLLQQAQIDTFSFSLGGVTANRE